MIDYLKEMANGSFLQNLGDMVQVIQGGAKRL